jgi:PAS domain S-box-containing protein
MIDAPPGGPASPGNFMPTGSYASGHPGIFALDAGGQALMALSFCSIAVTLWYFFHQRKDLRFTWMFAIFTIFLVACGLTHLIGLWTLWHPSHSLEGGIGAIAAAAALCTALLLIKWVPIALRLPSPQALQQVNSQLQLEIGERRRAEEGLRRMNATLEMRVAERTAELQQVNRALVQDHARFALAADAAGIGFWSTDILHNVTVWDDQMFRLYGRSPQQGDPHTLYLESLHPDDRERCAQETREVIEQQRAYDMEFRIIHPNGSIRHLRAAARIMLDENGHAARLFGVNFDVTDLKRADELFRQAIEAAPTGMLLMDLNGTIALVNAQIESLFGYPRAELLGRQIEMLVPERYRKNHPAFRQGFFSEPRTRPMGAGRDLYGLRRDGTEVPIEIGLNPLYTSESEFVLSSIVDLSHRREIDRIRSDFISTVSHELRTPLTSISGSLGLLRSGAMGALPEKAAAMVRIAHLNSGRLVRIINDILDIGSLEAGRVALQPLSVPLLEFLQQSIEANSAYAEKYSVRFVLDETCGNERVRADPHRLMQVVTNLLSNAAKFSPPGADVHIRARPGATTIRIEVEDAGHGIPDAFRSRIFEKFAQADGSATRRYEGTGLGLSIARKLMEAMGGTIGFDSVVGRGTTFYIELPHTEMLPAVRHDQPPAVSVQDALSWMNAAMSANHSTVRLLYVEHDDNLIRVISDTLGSKAEIVRAHSLLDAERLLRERHFELIVVDQSLPDGDGTSLVDKIPGLLEHAVPVIVLAAGDLPHHVHQKVSAVLLKTRVSPVQIATAISAYLP